MSARQKSADAASPGLETARRLVIKVGSALLVDEGTGVLKHDWLDALADDIAACRARGQDVILVSSGAIAVGRRDLGLPTGQLRLDEKQAAAACGMIRLAHAYRESLARHQITVAQVLLTLHDTEERRRHLNARGTIAALLRQGVVPVINENDTVATEEIRFGDNDRLAARVAQMVSADTLVLLSDIDGLYTADPRRDAGASRIDEVTEITEEIEAMAGKAPPGASSGGMVTKLAAAKVAFAAGCRMMIADGTGLRPLSAVAEGAPCTWFLPPAGPRAARKRWIAGSLRPGGVITIDDGAAKALANGRSLLPAGVTAVEGSFERGDAVVVRDAGGRDLGRGLSAYSSADAVRIKGYKSSEIEAVLGYRGRDEMIHRDDLVVS
jgi:glutamate 5-kinase